ncbi:hypothetical protein F5883DRAFT_34173 [Diaporthe sp. PMI_573]|nr:hypothetical protein F5883DRAFT_34173 [Diaporthaceae sp. PMI_573]
MSGLVSSVSFRVQHPRELAFLCAWPKVGDPGELHPRQRLRAPAGSSIVGLGLLRLTNCHYSPAPPGVMLREGRGGSMGRRRHGPRFQLPASLPPCLFWASLPPRNTRLTSLNASVPVRLTAFPSPVAAPLFLGLALCRFVAITRHIRDRSSLDISTMSRSRVCFQNHVSIPARNALARATHPISKKKTRNHVRTTVPIVHKGREEETERA